MMTSPRWYSWHNDYDDLETVATRRLQVVQETLTQALDMAPRGALRAISMCAGQARDLLPILINHPRGQDISAMFVERDELNAAFLLGAIGSTGLVDIDVVQADAGNTDTYLSSGPADLVLLGGVFANIDLIDARSTVDTLTALCRPGAVVVWSCYGPRLTEAAEIPVLFEAADFQRITARHDAEDGFTVAAHRYRGQPTELRPGRQFFRFTDVT